MESSPTSLAPVRRPRIVLKIIGRTAATVLPSIEEDPETLRGSLKKKGIPLGWEHLFRESNNEFAKIDFQLGTQQRLGKTIFPLIDQVFYAFEMCPLEKVRVVIIGQDPYPSLAKNGRPQAMGMSFSCQGEIPRSALNIFKMIQRSYPNFRIPATADFTPWAEQGVLLLNATLTVNANEPNSHQGWWDGFIHRVLQELNKLDRKVVYLLWGGFAQKMESKIPYEHAIILNAPHPVARNFKDSDPNGFVSCGHFGKVNQFLREWGEPEIDWTL